MSDVRFHEINIFSRYSIYSPVGFPYGLLLHFPLPHFQSPPDQGKPFPAAAGYATGL